MQKRNYPGLCLPPGPTSQPRQCPSAARYCGRSLTVASVNNEDGPYFAELLRVLDESGRIRYAHLSQVGGVEIEIIAVVSGASSSPHARILPSGRCISRS